MNIHFVLTGVNQRAGVCCFTAYFKMLFCWNRLLIRISSNVNKLRIKGGKKEADYKTGRNKMLKKTYHSGKEQRK